MIIPCLGIYKLLQKFLGHAFGFLMVVVFLSGL